MTSSPSITGPRPPVFLTLRAKNEHTVDHKGMYHSVNKALHRGFDLVKIIHSLKLPGMKRNINMFQVCNNDKLHETVHEAFNSFFIVF